MYDRRTLAISSKDMEPTEFDSMRKAAETISVGEGVIRYTRNNGRDFLNPITYGILPFRQLRGGAFWPGSRKQGYS